MREGEPYKGSFKRGQKHGLGIICDLKAQNIEENRKWIKLRKQDTKSE